MSLPVETQSQYESYVSSLITNLALLQTSLGAVLAKQATLVAALTGADTMYSGIAGGSESVNSSAQLAAVGAQVKYLTDAIENLRKLLDQVPYQTYSYASGCGY